MSDPALWAKTQDQIDRLNEARSHGGLCAARGLPHAEGDTAYMERFAVGPRRVGQGSHRSTRWAPVGEECADPDLVERATGEEPDRCAQCGRRVVYRTQPGVRRRVACSRQCLEHLKPPRQQSRARADMPAAVYPTLCPDHLLRGDDGA